MADYRLDLYSSGGQKIGVLSDFLRMEYVLHVNQVSALHVTVPGRWEPLLFDSNGLLVDSFIVINRRPVDGSWKVEGDTGWMLRLVETVESKDAPLVLTAFSASELIDRRIVAYEAASAQADKSTMALETIISEIIQENFGTLATDPNRDLSAYLTLAAFIAAGPTLSKAFSRRICSNVIQELLQDSYYAGYYMAYDVVWTGSNQFQFRLFRGQRGVDRRFGSQAIPVGMKYGNLEDVQITYDYSKEFTFIYAGGQGTEAARVIATASDSTRLARSPFNRREQFVDARMSSAVATVQAEAQAALKEGEPKIKIVGRLKQTAESIYGVHYGWGDFLRAEVKGRTYDCRLNRVHVNVAKESEVIEAYLEYGT